MLFNSSVQELMILIPALLLAFTVHELCHGLAAYALGDSTAKNDGRLSLNPIRHLDPIGFLCILIAGFGWAKPVMVNPGNGRNLLKSIKVW
jgi:Zn-dependent protease